MSPEPQDPEFVITCADATYPIFDFEPANYSFKVDITNLNEDCKVELSINKGLTPIYDKDDFTLQEGENSLTVDLRSTIDDKAPSASDKWDVEVVCYVGEEVAETDTAKITFTGAE